MKNLVAMTSAHQPMACSWFGAQNSSANSEMTASVGMVISACRSLRAKIASSSYSNSGFSVVPWLRRARASLMSGSRLV